MGWDSLVGHEINLICHGQHLEIKKIDVRVHLTLGGKYSSMKHFSLFVCMYACMYVCAWGLGRWEEDTVLGYSVKCISYR